MDEKRRIKNVYLAEIADLLSGAAFPLMLALILGASIISYASYGEDKTLAVMALTVGEILLALSYIIFGRHNGIAAFRKTLQQAKKRELGTDDEYALHGVGEYALWKGFAIGFISCVPYIIFQIIGAAAPNSVCDFMLQYAFGWAYFPLSFVQASPWLNLVWVIPATCVHAAAYVYGVYGERAKWRKIKAAEERSKGNYESDQR